MRSSTLAVLLVLAAAQAARAADCHLQPEPLAFGTYTPSEPARAAAPVRIVCFSLQGETVDLSVSLSDSAPSAALSGPSGRMAYRLFLDPALARPWSPGAPGFSTRLTIPAGQTASAAFTVYAQAPSRQLVPAGDFGGAILLDLDVR